jgi:hypothetical protein
MSSVSLVTPKIGKGGGMNKVQTWIKKRYHLYQTGYISYTDPLSAGRHPFQVFLLLLCFVSGLTQILGAEAPDSLEQNLPSGVVTAWGWMLITGSFSALIGSFWSRNSYATGLTIERVGLFATGVSAVIYGIFVLSLGLNGAVAGGITIGFGFACLLRARHIGKIFKRALDKEG